MRKAERFLSERVENLHEFPGELRDFPVVFQELLLFVEDLREILAETSYFPEFPAKLLKILTFRHDFRSFHENSLETRAKSLHISFQSEQKHFLIVGDAQHLGFAGFDAQRPVEEPEISAFRGRKLLQTLGVHATTAQILASRLETPSEARAPREQTLERLLRKLDFQGIARGTREFRGTQPK